MDTYYLETIELTKVFRHNIAVNKVNLHMKEGEIYGLIGQNGAGKTTIMKMITNLINRTSGDIIIHGKKDTIKNHTPIGTLIETPGLINNLSAYENIRIKCNLAGIKDGDKHTKELLAMVGLDDTKHKPVKEFSLGMRQRVGIALAIVGFPKIILLDEPINGLDPQGIIEMRNLFLKLKTMGITIMISSHIIEELKKVADTFGIIHKGELIKEISRSELDTTTQSSIRIEVDDVHAARKILCDIPNITIKENSLIIPDVTLQTSRLNKILVDKGIQVSMLFIEHEASEEIILKLMEGNVYA